MLERLTSRTVQLPMLTAVADVLYNSNQSPLCVELSLLKFISLTTMLPLINCANAALMTRVKTKQKERKRFMDMLKVKLLPVKLLIQTLGPATLLYKITILLPRLNRPFSIMSFTAYINL